MKFILTYNNTKFKGGMGLFKGFFQINKARNPQRVVRFLQYAFLNAVVINPLTFAQNPEQIELPYRLCGEYKREKIKDLTFASDNVNELLTTTFDSKILLIDNSTLKDIWSTQIGGEILSSVLYKNDFDKQIYVLVKKHDVEEMGGNEKNENNRDIRNIESVELNLSAVSAKTGLVIWQIKLADEARSVKVSVDIFDDYLLISSHSGVIWKINRKNGNLVWKKNLGTKLLTAPVFNQEFIYIGGLNGINIVSKSNGELEKNFSINKKINAVYTAGDQIIYGTATGEVYSIDKTTRKKHWSIRTGAAVTNIIDVDNKMLITSLDNFIYLISQEKGQIIWKKRLSERIELAPSIKNGKVVVPLKNSSAAPILDLETGRMVNQIVLSSDDYFLSPVIAAGNNVIINSNGGIKIFSQNVYDCK